MHKASPPESGCITKETHRSHIAACLKIMQQIIISSFLNNPIYRFQFLLPLHSKLARILYRSRGSRFLSHLHGKTRTDRGRSRHIWHKFSFDSLVHSCSVRAKSFTCQGFFKNKEFSLPWTHVECYCP